MTVIRSVVFLSACAIFGSIMYMSDADPGITSRPFFRQFWHHAISYSISSGLNETARNKIVLALNIVSLYTENCIKFKQLARKTSTKHIHFEHHPKPHECHAHSQHSIKLGAECLHLDILVHEIMHALGFSHEHQRPDRNGHVHIHEVNLKTDESVQRQFRVLPHMETYSLGYDVNSVMHYDEFEPHFAVNKSQAVITFKQERQPLFHIFSQLDVAKLRAAYQCHVKNTKDTDESIPSSATTPAATTSVPVDDTVPPWQNPEHCSQSTTFQQHLYAHASILHCTWEVTHADLQILIDRFERLHYPVGIFLYDSKKYLKPQIFQPISRQVVILNLQYCVRRSTSETPYILGFRKLQRFQLSHCLDLDIRKQHFDTLAELRMMTLHNCTVLHLDRDTFSNLPQLHSLSLDYASPGITKRSPAFRAFLYRLHCGKKFAWFRCWLEAFPQYFQSRMEKEIYHTEKSFTNAAVDVDTLRVLYDCETNETVALSTGGQHEMYSLFSENPCSRD
ncbi:uncharacterized protein LOC129585523 [Paramacrobiotus metropolitanus]|uniref:uncharacterized protein LOC129585523 n=1 Tax=Paramacrobiotus metropolitanus TaxID=2943436 RepID=UPI002446156D|nr:uncharacterized protein LOC129585523 [Paramacrobiotus metropolitanus]